MNPVIKKIFFIVILCVIFFTKGVQAQESEIYQPGQMQPDLNKFKHALEYVHPDLYAHITKDEFSQLFKKLYEQASVPLNAVQFHNIILQLIGGIHDGHTRVSATNKLRSYINKQKLLPFHILIQNERIFLTRNLSGQQIKDGSEIIAIDGMLSNQIIDKLMQHFGGDGLSRSSLEYRFGSSYNSFYRVFPLIFGFRPLYYFTIRDYETKTIKTIEISAISNSDFRATELAKYGNNLHTESIDEVLAQKAFSIDFDKNNKYACMKINRFFKDDYEEPANTYPDFYATAFQQIKERKINNLIIDLRGNGGGIGSNAAHLIQYLTTKSFVPTTEISLKGNDKYYRAITKDSLGLDEYFNLVKGDNEKYIVRNSDNIIELKEFKPIEKYFFKGAVYVLIDGGTVSAAGMAAGLLREYTSAIFVGAETGGHGGMSNGIRQINISGDNTDIMINLPLLHSEFNITSQLKQRGIVPDYWIENSIYDYINKKDAVLTFVLGKINEKDKK